jgi:hypothetical protein
MKALMTLLQMDEFVSDEVGVVRLSASTVKTDE